MHAHAQARTGTHTHMHTHRHTHAHVHARTGTHTHAHNNTYNDSRTCTYRHTRSNAHNNTHIRACAYRLAQRWGLSNGHSVEQTEADLKVLFPESSWRDAHLQVFATCRYLSLAGICHLQVSVTCRYLLGWIKPYMCVTHYNQLYIYTHTSCDTWHSLQGLCLGLSKTIYIRCTFGSFGLDSTKYTVNRTTLISPRINIFFDPAGWLREAKIII